MANLTTTLDILEDALFKAGADPSDTSNEYYAQGLEYVNRVHLDLCNGKGPLDPKAHVNFAWAMKYPPASLVLEPKYDTGTVSVTNGSNAITFSASITSSRTGWHLILDDEDDVFYINSHSGGSDSATLDAAFTGYTAAAASYKLVKVIYEIGSNDILRLITPMRIMTLGTDHSRYQIDQVDYNRFDEDWPLSRINAGVPTKFRVVNEDDGNIYVQFNKYMDEDNLRVEYPYIVIPTDLETGHTPKVPRRFRYVMSDFTAALLMNDRSDSRAERMFVISQTGFQAMVQDDKKLLSDTNAKFGQLVPRWEQYPTRYYRELIDKDEPYS